MEDDNDKNFGNFAYTESDIVKRSNLSSGTPKDKLEKITDYNLLFEDKDPNKNKSLFTLP